MLLAQLNESQGLPYEPSTDGFAFSAAEITRRLDRARRLRQAKALFQPSLKQPNRRTYSQLAA
jgi:hypothetical protein